MTTKAKTAFLTALFGIGPVFASNRAPYDGTAAERSAQERFEMFQRSSNSQGSFALQAKVARVGRADVGSEAWAAMVREGVVNNPVKAEVTDRLLNEYRAVQGSYVQDSKLIGEERASSDKMFVALSVATAADPTGVSAAVFGYTQMAENQRLDALLTDLKSNRDQNTKALVEGQLDYLRQVDRDTYKEVLGLDIEAAQKKIFGSRGGVFDEDFIDQLEPSEQTLVIKARTDVLSDVLAAEKLRGDQLAGHVRHNRAEIEGAKKQIQAVHASLNQFAHQTQGAIQRLQEGQALLASTVKDIQDELMVQGKDIAQLKTDVDLTQQVLWGKMSVNEQVDALKSGFFSRLEPSKREALREKLESYKRFADIQDAAKTVLTAGQNLATIAAGLGVDSKVVAAVHKAVHVGNSGLNVVGAIVSGNPMRMLEAVAGVFGLFGGSGPDVGELRHQEVMGKLGELMAGQQQIMRTQEQIMQTQVQIANMVQAIARQMQINHRQILAGLDRIYQKEEVLQKMLSEVLTQDLRLCHAFLDGRSLGGSDNDGGEFSFSDGEFKTYEHQRQHFQTFAGAFQTCQKGLESVFVTGRYDLSNVFLTHSAPLNNSDNETRAANEQLESFRKYTFEPTWAYTRRHWLGAQSEQPQTLVLGQFLANPQGSFGQWGQGGLSRDNPLTKGLTPFQALGASPASDRSVIGILSQMIFVPAVLEVAKFTLETAPYFELKPNGSDLDSRLLSAEELMLRSEAPNGVLARRNLRSLLDVVRYSIAQQTMVSGEAVMAALYEAIGLDKKIDLVGRQKELNEFKEKLLETGRPGEIALQTCTTGNQIFDATCVLDQNPYARANFANYWLSQRLHSNKVAANNVTGYRLALAQSDDDLLSRTVGRHLRFVQQGEQKTWSIQLASTSGELSSLELPAAERVRSQAVLYPGEMGELVRLRNHIVSELSAARPLTKLSGDELRRATQQLVTVSQEVRTPN